MSHLLTLDDLTQSEIEALYAQATLLKRTRARPGLGTPLQGRTLALLFEKPSLRTRVSFTLAAQELGAQCLYLSPQEVGLGQRESVADVARVLSSYVDGIVLRTFSHATVEEFARAAYVPVINGLTDGHHPCQGLTDLFTIAEQRGDPAGQTLAYVGDGNNVAHSLLQAAARAGMHVRFATPEGFEPDPVVVAAAQRESERSGGSLTLLHSPTDAATGADVLYTDVWTSMGQESEHDRRTAIFSPYQVNATLLTHARPDAIVMHPLPAHRGQEITDDVLDGPQSRVFVQAENRLHVQKAILLALLGARTAAASLSA